MVWMVSHMTQQTPTKKTKKFEPMTATRMDEIKATLSKETISAIIDIAAEQGVTGKDEIISQFLKPFCVEFEMCYGDQPTKEKLALKRLRNFISFRGVAKEGSFEFTYCGHTFANFNDIPEARVIGWLTESKFPVQIRAEGSNALAFAGAKSGDVFEINTSYREGSKTIWAREQDGPITINKSAKLDSTDPCNVLDQINCATVQELQDGELFGLIRCDVYKCNRFDGGAFVKYGDATVTRELDTRAGGHVPLFQPGSEVVALVRAYYSKKHSEVKAETAMLWLIDGAAMPESVPDVPTTQDKPKLDVTVTKVSTGKVTSL